MGAPAVTAAATRRNGMTALPSPARSITAAAKVLSPKGPDRKAAKRQNSGWQDEAWTYWDDLPEIKFIARFLGNALSRLRLYPAIVVNADDAPVAVDEAVEVEGSGVDERLAAAVAEEWARLEQGEGMAGLLREFGVCLTISGEANLVGRDDPDDPGQELWQVYSESALSEKDGRYSIQDTPSTSSRTELAEDAYVVRIWRRHSRWPGLPDSNMRAVLDICEELLISARAMRATIRSRNNAGILKLPNELDFATFPRVAPTDEELDGDEVDPDEVDPDVPADPPISDTDDMTDLERGVIESMVTPTADDGSASQVAPHLLRGPAEALKAVDWISLARDIDPQLIERIVMNIKRLATGMDVPVEVLTGVADTNHWNAWQIEDSTYKAHVEPLAQVPAYGFATAFLRPMLRQRPEFAGNTSAMATIGRIVIAIDPSALVVRPNRAADAKEAYGLGVISEEALRQHLSFSETEMPTMEERLMRYALERSVGGMSLTRDLLEEIGYDVPRTPGPDDEGDGGGPVTPPSGDGGDSGEDGGEATPDQEESGLSRLALLLAAASAAGQLQLGDQLASIDARVRERLQFAASEQLTQALTRAGSRLRAIAQGDPELRAAVNGRCPSVEVGARLHAAGLTSAATLPAAAELIGPDDFTALHDRFLTMAAQARAEGQAVVRRELSARGVEPESMDTAARETLSGAEEDDEAGWALLLAALVTLGRARVFTPDGTPDDGEFDPHMAVPPGLIRDALARAGGAIEVGGAGSASGGPASGARMLEFVHRLGVLQVAWRWSTGLPSQPFPPHQSLAGVVFRAWDDPQLSYGGWPANGGYLRPGDHLGCACDATPILVLDQSAAVRSSADTTEVPA